MAVWTVFQPDEAKGAGRASAAHWADGVVFVRERMSWSALLFAPLVLLRHRLWLAFAVYVLLQALIVFALVWLDLGDGEALLVFLPNLLVALELPALRRRKLAARGYDELGAVVAPDFEAAERRFFEGWLTAGAPEPAPSATPPRFAAPATAMAGNPVLGNPVLGLFPEAAGR